MERLFGTVVGWLIGLGMVLFGLVGFIAINQATPLSSSSYLASPAAASATPPSTAPSTPPSTPPSTTGKGSGTGKGATGKGGGKTSQGSGPTSPTELASLGQTIIQARCVACHVINGSGGVIGPNLDKVMAGQTLPGMVPGGHPTQAAWLNGWIANPQKVWPQAIMPSLGLTAQQVQEVVAYLTTKVK